MPAAQKIWELVAIASYYCDDKKVLWNECIYLLNHKEKFLENNISEQNSVNYGFQEAKSWLMTQGLKEASLSYALQLTAYQILMRNKDDKDMSKDLTEEWLASKKIGLKNDYLKLPKVSKTLLDTIGVNILARENIRFFAQGFVVSTFFSYLVTFLMARAFLALNLLEENPFLRTSDSDEDKILKCKISQYLIFLIYTLIGGALITEGGYRFFANRQGRRKEIANIENYNPNPEELNHNKAPNNDAQQHCNQNDMEGNITCKMK